MCLPLCNCNIMQSILNDEMKVGDEEAVLPGTSQAKTTPQQVILHHSIHYTVYKKIDLVNRH